VAVKGSRNCQRDETPTAEWLPLPATVALSILEKAEHLLPLVCWDPRDLRSELLRKFIASITACIFFIIEEIVAPSASQMTLWLTTTTSPFAYGKRKGRRRS